MNDQCPSHIKTSQLICSANQLTGFSANQLTGFYMRGALVVYKLNAICIVNPDFFLYTLGFNNQSASYWNQRVA